MKKVLWIITLIVLAGATYFMINGLQSEMKNIQVIDDGKEKDDMDPLSKLMENEDFEIDDAAAFFNEYRMERDKVRAQEKEILEELIDNDKASDSSRGEAEKNLLALVDRMEKELLLENMVKAQGFDDAIFFYRDDMATVMVRTKGMNQIETAQVIDAAAGVIGIERESVQVLMQY